MRYKVYLASHVVNIYILFRMIALLFEPDLPINKCSPFRECLAYILLFMALIMPGLLMLFLSYIYISQIRTKSGSNGLFEYLAIAVVIYMVVYYFVFLDVMIGFEP